MGPRKGVKSREFKSEELFCDEIERLIKSTQLQFRREHPCDRTDARADFYINECDVFIEAKIDVSGSCFDRAIGQALRYKLLEGGKVWLVVPNDVQPTEEQKVIIAEVDAAIVRISDLKVRIIQQCEIHAQDYVEWYRRHNDTTTSTARSTEITCRRLQLAMSSRLQQKERDELNAMRAKSGLGPYEEIEAWEARRKEWKRNPFTPCVVAAPHSGDGKPVAQG